jgi:REP element-mobilizing transposase RayT
MNTAWLLTSTFYGNWLPGDRRGFVGRVWDKRDGDDETVNRQSHDLPGMSYDEDISALEETSKELMRGAPVLIVKDQADVLLAQFKETAAFRGWHLHAVAIMPNHVHLVVVADETTDPTKILGDFKAYGSRALTKQFGKPASGTWWTSKGSKRKLKDDTAVEAAIRYVMNQHEPLVIWCKD